MGKTPKPLVIWVADSMVDLQVFRDLREQGHTVLNIDSITNYETADLLLGPNCWRMTPALLKHLPLAIKGARQLAYPKKSADKPAAVK